MTDIDDAIRKGLSADDAAFLDRLEKEQGLFQQLGETLHGPMRFWSRFAFVFAFIATGLGVYCIVQLFNADTTRGQIVWLFWSWAAWTAQVQLKQWLHHRMNTLEVIREIKKLELRLAADRAA